MFERELTLQEHIKNSWLVQRLRAPVGRSNPFSFGGGLRNGGFSQEAMDLLMSIFSFDYMGAAEFEHGAVPNVFKFLTSVEITSGETNGMYYICAKQNEDEIKVRIQELLEGKARLKESLGLRMDTILGWVELDNGFLFFRNKEMFDKTLELLKGISN